MGEGSTNLHETLVNLSSDGLFDIPGDTNHSVIIIKVKPLYKSNTFATLPPIDKILDGRHIPDPL